MKIGSNLDDAVKAEKNPHSTDKIRSIHGFRIGWRGPDSLSVDPDPCIGWHGCRAVKVQGQVTPNLESFTPYFGDLTKVINGILVLLDTFVVDLIANGAMYYV
jgi:hypothetical protein